MTTILRSDVEKALDDLISNEAGMVFQGLAVVLAKKRWPELIACERKKDFGVDAIARANAARNGVGKALACSITATLRKIRADATEAKKHFDDITVLIFATPRKVTNPKQEEWAKEIEKDFGYQLVVMPREEFITSLMDPVNAPLCRSHLGIPITAEDDAVVELFQRAQKATSEAIAAWSVRLKDKPLIDLRAVKIDQDGRDTAEVFQLSEINAALAQSRRMVIEAPAGRGKTTTLVQLAGKPVTRGLSFLIDLPAWIKSRTGILQFIAGMPSFQSRSLDAEALARLYKAEHFSFFLNGWNEITDSDSIRASEALAELERNFPAAGILVATRTHHIVPPLPGAWRVRLLPLTRAQRTQYLKQRLGGRADELRSKLDADPVLDDLTRTPFILSEVTVIFEAGAPIPATKLGVLRGVMRVLEQSPEHRNHLQLTPLSGRADEYLSAVAIEMTEQGGVTTPEDHARSIVSTVAIRLRDALQISTPPEPSAVLGALCAHHILERVEYPTVSFRFEHQQFQEFYVAERLNDQLPGLTGKHGTEGFRDFIKRYVNEPAWSEPLRMIAQEIGAAGTPSSDAAIKSGSLLITMALSTDPVYAAELSRLCGASVWLEVGSAVGSQLRSLYQAGDANYREYALAGMIATGSEDFSDIILPLLASDNQHVRLTTYRTWGDFHVSSLGQNWQTIVSEWQEEARSDFVSELIHAGNLPPNLLPFLLADSSSKVKEAAISALVWIGSNEDAAKLLDKLDDERFEAALRHFSLQEIPESIRARAMAVYEKLASQPTDTLMRVRTLVRRAELGDSDIVADLKAELSKCDASQVKQLGDFVLKPALEIVQKKDAEWVSHWVANRILDGALWHDHWIALVTTIPQDLKETLLHRIENEDFKHVRHSGIVAVLAACSVAALVERVFAKLCSLWDTIAKAPDQRHEIEHAIKSQLEDLFRAIPVKLAVTSLSSRLSGQVNAVELAVVAHLFGRRGQEDSDLRYELDTNRRQALRAYLKNGVSAMLQEEDFSGVHKADLATALAHVGEPEDMASLRELIRADIERVRKGRAARACGERNRLANGGVMSYSNWHVRAVVQLDRDTADPLLLELLKEPEYERDAALALVDLARTPVSPKMVTNLFGNKRSYRDIWQARTAQVSSGFNDGRRNRYAAAIRERVKEVLEEYGARGQAASYDFRLGELTKVLASLDSHGSADLIWRALSFSGRRDDWRTVETLEILLFNGIGLPTEESLKIFDAILQQVRPHLYDNQHAGLLARALCLLPFVDSPSAGIAKVRQVISELRFPLYELRDVATALGHSRCPEALQVLRDLVPDKIHAEQLGDAWINALSELDTPDSRQLLLSFLDPAVSGLPAEITFEREDVLESRLVELARQDTAIQQRILELCNEQSPPSKHLLLSSVVAWLGSPEAILAGLNLIDDSATPPVPREIWNLIETAFLERRPYGKDSNSYTLAPRSSNSIRARLFEMVTQDERRKKSALALLGQVEVWRIEHGRPNGEPRNPALGSLYPWPPVVQQADSRRTFR